jgi:hypothetical protein
MKLNVPRQPTLIASLMPENLSILSVNVAYNYNRLAGILKTTTASFVITQKPPWGCLVPLRSDIDPDGMVVQGMVNHPG